MISYKRDANQVSNRQLQIILVVVLFIFSAAWIVKQEKTRSSGLPSEDFHLLIDEAKGIRQELSEKQPAPKIIETWRKVFGATKYFGLEVELLTSESADQAGMYSGPLPSWHLKVLGRTPEVLTFLKSINNANLYVYPYHYTLEDRQMSVMMSVVGNI